MLRLLKKHLKGFTVLELLIVIAITGVLASIVVVGFSGHQEKARDAQRKSDFHQIMVALESFYTMYGHYPIMHYGGFGHGGEEWTRSVDGPPDAWIEDVDCGGAGEPACGDFSNYISITPVDPINTSEPFPCYANDYLYGYRTTADGQHYDLIAQLENKNDNQRCEKQCYKVHTVSAEEGTDYFLCAGCGGIDYCDNDYMYAVGR